jgi:acyl carrier protein phosphodiesterase
MNYLAHIFLARQSDDAMLGSLLGDFCKPGQSGEFSPETHREIHIHRRVDAFTDSHPIVLNAKSLFSGQTRRFAGISLDVFYDHMLAKTWARYSEQGLDTFIENFYRMLMQRRGTLPTRLEMAATHMTTQDWLGSYREFVGVRIALERTSRRLSKHGDRLIASVADLEQHYASLASGFHDFFPQLQRFVAQERAQYVPADLSGQAVLREVL